MESSNTQIQKPKKRGSLSLLRDGRKIKLVYFIVMLVTIVNGFTFWFFNPTSEQMNENVKIMLIESTMYVYIATVIAYITGNVIEKYNPKSIVNGNSSQYSEQG